MSHIIGILVHVAPDKSFIRDIHLYLCQFDQYQYQTLKYLCQSLIRSLLLLGCLYLELISTTVNDINKLTQRSKLFYLNYKYQIITRISVSSLLSLLKLAYCCLCSVKSTISIIFLLGINFIKNTYILDNNTSKDSNKNITGNSSNNNIHNIIISTIDMKPGPSEIAYRNMRFLILDRPSDTTLPQLIEEFRKLNVRDVIRVCEPSYKIDALTKAGIEVHDWQFDDGSPPPQDIIDNWFELLRNRYKDNKDYCMAVHCVAGLGRGPVMVALALMELGMQYEDTIEYIRERRRGAFNQKQLKYLASYKPKSRLRNKKSSCRIF